VGTPFYLGKESLAQKGYPLLKYKLESFNVRISPVFVQNWGWLKMDISIESNSPQNPKRLIK
jgi:hypothetical protein